MKTSALHTCLFWSARLLGSSEYMIPTMRVAFLSHRTKTLLTHYNKCALNDIRKVFQFPLDVLLK